VVASYLHFDTSDGASGSVKFTLGVGERGIPLSPDTLVLPSSVDALPGPVIDAAMRVLGQAWSIANAPAGTLPRGVLRTSKTVVTEKALGLAEAGLRVNLGEPLSDSLRNLAFDFYGGSPMDAAFDQLLRQTDAGHSFAVAVGSELAAPIAAGGGVTAYEQALAEVAVSGPDFVSIAVGGNATGADLALTDGAGHRTAGSHSVSQVPTSEVVSAVFLPA